MKTNVRQLHKRRNPTMVAECGCPYDPEYDAGYLGWHLPENHVDETIQSAMLSLKEGLRALETIQTVRRKDSKYRRHLRIYDEFSDIPQPSGPVELDVAEDAPDEEIIDVIKRDYVPWGRDFLISWNGPPINEGWTLKYVY